MALNFVAGPAVDDVARLVQSVPTWELAPMIDKERPCLLVLPDLAGPAASFGHEEMNEAGEIEQCDKLVNPDPNAER